MPLKPTLGRYLNVLPVRVTEPLAVENVPVGLGMLSACGPAVRSNVPGSLSGAKVTPVVLAAVLRSGMLADMAAAETSSVSVTDAATITTRSDAIVLSLAGKPTSVIVWPLSRLVTLPSNASAPAVVRSTTFNRTRNTSTEALPGHLKGVPLI